MNFMQLIISFKIINTKIKRSRTKVQKDIKQMKEFILIKPGELVLKGLNKKDFEKKLIKDIKTKINRFGNFKIKSSQSVISVEPLSLSVPTDNILDVLKNRLSVDESI